MENNTVTKISSQEFIERIVLSKQDALVKVTSAWSGAGQLLGHAIQDLAAQYTKVNFFSIDYDAESALAATYRVEPIPTLLFFKKGTLVDKLSGLTHKSIISDKINQLVNQ
jgi:thioredoxin 1